MNCLIVDDDDVSRAEVEQLLRKFSFLKLIASCSNAKDALLINASQQIDLVFLDVMMPEVSGLDFIEALPHHKPQIILMTLEKKYAVNAFDHDVTDFLVKPLTEMRFIKAISKAKNVHEQRVQRADTEFIFVKVNDALVKINIGEILYIESLGDYLSIYTEKSRFIIHMTMKAIMDKLPTAGFFRAHNSFIVRLDKISKIEDNTIIIDKKLIPLSRSHKNELMERLKLL